MAKKKPNQDERSLKALMSVIANAFTLRQDLAKRKVRDLDKECGYPKEIGDEDYQDAYDRNEIAARVNDILPDESWNTVPEIYEDEQADETEFDKRFKTVEERVHLFHYMHRIDRLSGINRFGALLLGYNDGASTLDQPVVRKDGMDLLFVRAFPEKLVKIAAYEENIQSHRFGLPTYYELTFADPESDEPSLGSVPNRVHWSRIVHVCDNRSTSEVFSTPRLQRPWNRLLDLKKICGGSAEMFWRGAFPGISFELNPDIVDATLDPDTLREEFRKYAEGLQRYLALEGVQAKSLAVQVADPTAQYEMHMKLICAFIGVPWRVFMGSEEAKLASEKDDAAWKLRLHNRRTNYLTPFLIRPVIDQLIEFGVLPEPIGTEEEDDDTEPINNVTPGPSTAVPKSYKYCVDWPDPTELSKKERIEIAKIIIEILAKYIQAGIDDLVLPMQLFTLVLDYSEEDATVMLKAAVKQAKKRGTEGDDDNPLAPEPEPSDPMVDFEQKEKIKAKYKKPIGAKKK